MTKDQDDLEQAIKDKTAELEVLLAHLENGGKAEARKKITREGLRRAKEILDGD